VSRTVLGEELKSLDCSTGGYRRQVSVPLKQRCPRFTSLAALGTAALEDTREERVPLDPRPAAPL
jgi:hypothetical protein